jgi:inner membrane protein
MDNLTHGLVGALIGQAGLKRKTGLAMPALIIGANLPDVDAACTVYGIESLAMRRGLTHGPIAWVLLPLVLAGILWLYDRWQAKRGKRPEARLPVHFGWLYALSFIACLTHPALDWMNNYGIRFLEPFSSEWFYGDVLFIIDLWLWIGLGLATWLSLRREKRSAVDWRRPARVALAAAVAYMGVNGAITWAAEERALASAPYPRVAIASEVAVTFWRREMITGDGDGIWQVGAERVGDIALRDCDLVAVRSSDPRADAFLFWSRAPFVRQQPEGSWLLGDARFASRGGDRFSVALPASACRSLSD